MLGEPAQISLSLVLGADGSLTKNGSSRALSSAGDRQRFLALRRPTPDRHAGHRFGFEGAEPADRQS